MRSGSFTKPRPLEAFDCGSQSTSSVFTSAAAKDAARLMAVVVLPTPPFWLATAMTRPILIVGRFQSHPQHNAIRISKAMHIQVSGSLFCAKCVWGSTWNTRWARMRVENPGYVPHGTFRYPRFVSITGYRFPQCRDLSRAHRLVQASAV